MADLGFPLPLLRRHTSFVAAAISSGFVGRSDELGRLLVALERAEQGRPVMVLVAGDAGMGKTRLLAALADRARQRGDQVLVGGCLEVGDVGLPYLPLLDAFHDLTSSGEATDLLIDAVRSAPGLGRLLPELAQAGSIAVDWEAGLEQLQVLDVVRRLLARLGERSPVLLILEDLHWADQSTGELLAFLARALRSGRVMVVGSYRSDGLPRRHPLRPLLVELLRLPGLERIVLGPLSRAELATHLDAVSGVPLSPERVERIAVRSEGNPFYAEQLLAAGVGLGDVALPSTLADLLMSRIGALTEPAGRVLGLAAVAGGRVPHGLLAAVATFPAAELEQGLREAIDSGVLVADMESGSYQFRHALLREAVYGDLLPSERTRHHAAFAGQLAADPEGRAAELAHHCLGSHDLGGALAASVQAADDAERVLAPAEALRHLDQALGLWDQVARPAEAAGADRVDLILRAAAAAAAAGHFQRAIDLSDDALTRLDAELLPLRVAEVHERLAQSLLAMEQFDDLLQSCRRAVELVPEDPPSRLRARVTAALAQALWNIGQRQEARHWATVALGAARAVGSTGDEADALITLGLLADYDDPVQALELLAQAKTLATRGGEPAIALRAIYNRAALESDAGDLAAAIAGADEATALAQSIGLGWSQFGLGMRALRCYLRYCAGDWDASFELAAEVDEQTAAADPELSVAALAVEIGRGLPTVESRLAQLADLSSTRRVLFSAIAEREAELALWAGDLDRVRSAVDRGLRAVAPDASLAPEELILAVLGLTGEANRAERGLTTHDRSVDPEGQPPDEQSVGRLLLDRARRAAERGWRATDVRSVPTRGWLARAEAEWARLEGRSDPEAWQAAVDAFSPGYIYEMACCKWRLAEALLGIGDRAQASTAAREAYQIALQLDAGPLRDALEMLARRGRLDLGLGAPHARGDGGLTPRELEVLSLLVEGRSNRQIAEQLYISGKTVDVHITRILAKLGVHSRQDAAARARQLGLDRAMDSGQH